MKLLYISEFFFETNGAHQLSIMHYEILKDILGNKNLEVIALTGSRFIEEQKYIKFRGYNNKLSKLRNIVQLNNPKINNKIIHEICNIISVKNINFVFVDNSTYGKLVKQIKSKFNNVEVISFYHDVKRYLYKEWLKKIGLKFLPEYINGVYNEYLNQKYSDYNITLNKRESNIFRKYYKKEPSIELPIILNDNINQKSLDKSLDKDNIVLLFVGAYYYPNVEGVKYFVANILPYISNTFKLYIVGREMEKLKDEIEDERIKIIGTVDNLGIYYKMADIVIAPIFSGAGMKVKTAEAFLYGKMFIGTDESLVGYYDNIPKSVINKYIFRCNTNYEFIDILNNIDFNTIKKFNPIIKDIFDKYYSKQSAKYTLNKLLHFTNSVK